MSQLINILETLKEKINNSQEFLDKIINNYDEKISFSNLKLLSEISSNINLLELQSEELYYYMMETNNVEQTAEEINKLKSFKINNKIQEKLLPYMLFMKLFMENDVNEI